MLIVVAIILGFLIGKIRRGSLRGFKNRKISLLPVGIIGLVLQVALHFYSYTGGIPLIEPYLEIVNFASYILVLVMFVFNLDDFWVILLAMGFTSNFVVIFINGGHMPVSQTVINMLPVGFGQEIIEGLNPIYGLIQPNTLLWFLGINIPLPVPYVPTIMSLYGTVAGISAGTLLALIGFVGFIQHMMSRKRSIINDENLEYNDDEGIFGDEEVQNFDGVSIQNDGFLEGIDHFENDSFEKLAAKGAIRGERDESLTTVVKNDSEMTRVIPAMINEENSEIGTETEEIIVRNLDDDETIIIDQLDNGKTKVINTIQEVGTFVAEKNKEELEAFEMEEILNSDDAGFFTKKYYEEKLAIEKERLLEEVRNMELNKSRQSIEQPKPLPESDLRIIESFKMTELDRPFVLKGDSVYPEKSFPKEEKEEFSEDEMLNVWQRISMEDEKRKANRRKQTIQQSNKETTDFIHPSSDEQDIPVVLKEIEEVTEVNVKKVYKSTNKDKIIENMNTEERQKFNNTLEERKKAGYELIKLDLDGKEVAFWRKKKE
jgi:hypothetical protein